MNYTRYRWCVVSSCKNTSIKSPEKLFIRVPDDHKMRNVWLELAKRDPMTLSTKSRLYLCEDHFNLEQDMENFMEYKIMGSVKHVKMKANITPSRLCCHSERKRKLSPNQSTVTKIQKVDFIQEAEKSKLVEDYMEPVASSSKSDDADSDSDDDLSEEETLSTHSDGAGDSPKYTWRCDACRDAVSGPRYVCVECPHTYCATCEARGTHAQHYMLRVPGPRPEEEVQRIVKVIQKELADILSCAEPAEEEPEIKTEIKTEPEDIDPLGEEAPKEQLRPNALEQTMLDIDIKAEYECFEEEETCVAEPVVLKPVASQPVVSQRVASQPVVSQRVASQPVVSQRVASQPSTSQPVKSDCATDLPATCVQPTFTAGAIRTYKRTSSSLPQASAPKKSYITLDATSSRLVIQAAASTSVESSQTHEEASEFKPGITSNLQETRPQQGSRASKSDAGDPPQDTWRCDACRDAIARNIE